MPISTIGQNGLNAPLSLTSPTIATPTFTGQATIPTINLTGGQITFPATQSASSDANTLDDYEEGSWTPTVNLLGTVTYNAQTGRYIKIGKQVSVQVYLAYSSSNTTQDTNVMSMGGFPFTSSSSSTTGTSCLMTERMYGVESAAAPNTFHIFLNTSSTSFSLMQNNYNGSLANTSYYVSQVRSCYKGGTQYIHASFCYEASA